ncbi:MAG TPA: hypothetical protein VM659_21640 [Dongiaceae bacterium]|nr:hypothetical protein [Dongiaceae bacterium]
MLRLSPEIAHLSIDQTIDLLYLLFALRKNKHLNGFEGKPSRKLAQDEDIREVFPLLFDWPLRVHGLLDELANVDGHKTPGKIFETAQTRRLASQFKNREGQRSKELVSQAISAYTEKTGRFLHSQTRWIASPKATHHIRTAAEILCMNERSFRHFAKEQGCELYPTERGYRVLISDVEALSKLSREKRIPLSKVAKHLGLHTLAITPLILDGAFGDGASARKAADGRHKRSYITSTEFEDFKKRLSARIIATAGEGRDVTYGGFKGTYRPQVMTFSHVICALLDGKVRATTGSPEHTGRIRFVKADLLRRLDDVEGGAVRCPRGQRQLSKQK